MTRLLCSSSFGFADGALDGVFDEVVVAPVVTWEGLAAEADAIAVTASERIPDEVLGTAQRCRAIAVFGTGTDGINISLATELGILVANTPGIPTESVADLTLALILSLERHLAQARALVEEGATLGPEDSLGAELGGQRIGLVGFGHIGRAVARRALSFGMDVRYCRASNVSEPSINATCMPLDRLLESSDVISIHCPLTPQTRHLFDEQAFARLPPGAVFVNTARAQIVDEDALVAALDSGCLAGAAVDVWEGEPAAPQRLLGRPNVVLTPHLGGATHQARARMRARLRDHLVAIAEFRVPANVVDRTVLESESHRTRSISQL